MATRRAIRVIDPVAKTAAGLSITEDVAWRAAGRSAAGPGAV
ncbi:hypothetical protein [Pseudonocardia acidicola]|nr:hypothetical protein [Pseudonocardia acidicola]